MKAGRWMLPNGTTDKDMDTSRPHLATRLFNTPLAITPDRIAAIAAMLRDGRSGSAVLAYDSTTAAGQNVAANRPYQVEAGIAIIPVAGTLIQRSGSLVPFLDGCMGVVSGYDGIRANLSLAFSDPAVRAIVLDVDSRGGEIAGMLDLSDAIYASRGIKPLWAILTECAYSAAYGLASACDRVIVPRTGGTGSVGVIVAHTDFSKALDRAGVAVTLITSGARKADGSEFKPLSREAYLRIKADIDTLGELFIRTVARNRGLAVSKVRATQGATYLGGSGLTVGFADAVMSPDAAFARLLGRLDRPIDQPAQRGTPTGRSARRASGKSWSRTAYQAEIARAFR
ncbi:S49 family peptidase [Paraburkholderia sp. BR10954]|uniref:S49 family peptidase n=1 Tax=Paraburkholderia sp. BR10954 TaxID=3236995 RepID=UPI0034D2F76A